jgi:hypothetical protein
MEPPHPHRPPNKIAQAPTSPQRAPRAEYIAGAETEWLERTGRGMTAEEFERVLRRYPGDV